MAEFDLEKELAGIFDKEETESPEEHYVHTRWSPVLKQTLTNYGAMLSTGLIQSFADHGGKHGFGSAQFPEFLGMLIFIGITNGIELATNDSALADSFMQACFEGDLKFTGEEEYQNFKNEIILPLVQLWERAHQEFMRMDESAGLGDTDE